MIIPIKKSHRAFLYSAVLAACSWVARPVLAAEPTPDKSGYSLFHPTPAPFLREMSTDRPDKTESPYTVDAGHFQIESDLVTYSRDHDTSGWADTRVEAWSVAAINLKVGLCNRVDFQTVISTYNETTTRDAITGGRVRQSGFGDVVTRLKVNLWGNDGGVTAMGVMPFIKLPTNQDHLGNSHVEGGLIIPLAVDLPGGFGLGVMTEFDFNRDEDDRGSHAGFVNSVTLSHQLVGSLGGYVEFFSETRLEKDSCWIGTLDLGLTYGLTDHIQLDVGINVGLTDSADDLNPFVGVSYRF